MKSLAKEVFKKLEKAFVVPNVRDAVRGLSADSCLVGPVEFYGDRTVIVKSSGIAIKSPRTLEEEQKLSVHHCFLGTMGIGASSIVHAPYVFGSSEGIVDRLRCFPKEVLKGNIGDVELQFFVDTPESDQLTEWLEARKIGPSAHISRRINNKVCQREAVSGCSEEIFPPHFIAQTEEEAVKYFKELSGGGEVMLKIGHLASGEGMEYAKTDDDVIQFRRKWLPILESNGYEAKIIIEQKMRLAEKFNSISVQFFKDDGGCFYLGASVQHIASDGVVHEGNKIGADIYSQLPKSIEEEMIRKSNVMLSLLPEIRGFAGFDFIVCADGKILMTEINLRMTASTLLFALVPQIGSNMSFDLRKIHAGHPPKMSLVELLKKLERFNNPQRIMLPLNGRLFDDTGDMFAVVCAPTFDETEQIRNEVLSWLK